MTREEQDQALAAMGFVSLELPGANHGFGWVYGQGERRLFVGPCEGRYVAAYRIGRTKTHCIAKEMFDDPVSAAAYLLIQAADQP